MKVRICKVEGCRNKTGKRNRVCSTHQFRKKKFGSYRLDLKIGYREHGRVKSSIYRSWSSMKNRCTNPKTPDFKYYGARGVSLDPRWHDFLTFVKDMGEKPTAAHTIERIDNSRGYCKSNCRWATRREQSFNTRKNKLNKNKILQIKKLSAKGVYQKDLALKFKVGVSMIGRIVRGESWQTK